jgi:hypothetical protein
MQKSIEHFFKEKKLKTSNMKRITILQAIFSHFQQMTQWITTSPGNYSKYFNKAESLIELLEIHDCGSVGGFDKKSPVKWGESGMHLYDRFLALLRKEETKLKKEVYFTPETLRQYWKHISNEREEMFDEKESLKTID